MAESKKSTSKRSAPEPAPAPLPRIKVRKGALTTHVPADQLEAAEANGWNRVIPPGRQAPA